MALGFALLSSSPAQAQTDPDELAKVHFTAGAAYFEQGDYEGALREFQKAYDLSKRADLLLNIASVNERLNNLDDAIAALDQFLAEKPDEPNSDTVRIRRDNLIKRRDDQLARTRSDGPVQVTAEPQAPQTSPPPPPEAPPSSDSGPPPDEAPPSDNSGVGYVFLTIGGATAVGALVTGLIANGKHSDAEESCAPSCRDDELSAGRALATTSTVLTGVALVSGSLGLYFILSSSDDSDDASAELALKPTPGGAYAHAKWRF